MGFLHPFIQGNELFLIATKMHFRGRRCPHGQRFTDGLLFFTWRGRKGSIGLEFFIGSKVCGTMRGGRLLARIHEGHEGKAQCEKTNTIDHQRSRGILMKGKRVREHGKKLGFHKDASPHGDEKKDKPRQAPAHLLVHRSKSSKEGRKGSRSGCDASNSRSIARSLVSNSWNRSSRRR